MTSRKILIVEDESIVRLHLRRVVEAMGHEVAGLAASADEAFACAEAVAPDLVLMDIDVRGDRDGIETAGEIVRRHGCAIVFATAFADDETIRRTEEVGAIGYVLKPFGDRAVRAAVATALREHDRMSAARASEISLAGIIGSLGEAVLLTDAGFRVNFANPRAMELIRPVDGEFIGRVVQEILLPASDDRVAFHEVLVRAGRDGGTVILPTVALQRRDGSEVLVNGSVEPLTNANGDAGFVISLRDLSQRWFGSGEKADSTANPRMLIYSHDTFGLGHLRRSLNLAAALVAAMPNLSILIVTGSSLVHRFTLPPRVDYVKLPAVRKVAREQYSPRSLVVPDDDVLSIRANLLLRTVRDFKPNLLLVDHSPAGMRGEMRPTLNWLRENLPSCETIIGLRDIIDDPQAVRDTWHEQGIYHLLEESYDHIVVYGNRSFYDPVVEYAFPPALSDRARFLGHVVEDGDVSPAPMSGNGRQRVVVTTGGGDGAVDQVAGGFLEILKQGGLGQNVEAVILPGPLAPPELVASLQESSVGTSTVIHQFVESTSPHMASADLVICTGGYNTAVQVLRYAKRALMIPRVMHRREQYLRATRLAEMGLLRVLLPDEISPENLLAAVVDLLAEPREPLTEGRERGDISFDGAANMAAFCASLITPHQTATEAAYD